MFALAAVALAAAIIGAIQDEEKRQETERVEQAAKERQERREARRVQRMLRGVRDEFAHGAFPGVREVDYVGGNVKVRTSWPKSPDTERLAKSACFVAMSVADNPVWVEGRDGRILARCPD